MPESSSLLNTQLSRKGWSLPIFVIFPYCWKGSGRQPGTVREVNRKADRFEILGNA